MKTLEEVMSKIDKEQKIKQDNMIIAKFMGVKPYLNSEGRYEFMVAENSPITTKTLQGMYDWLDFLYHISWNDLMEVVSRIESIPNIGNGDSFEEFKRNCFAMVLAERDSFKIEVTYNTCLEFIKWHNKTTQQSLSTI